MKARRRDLDLTRRRPAAALLVLLLGLAGGVADSRPGRAAVSDTSTSIEATQARHPDDPDLLWALAMQLSRNGQLEPARERLERFVARWPNRRPDAHFELGKLFFGEGRDAQANQSFERAVRAQPASGPIRFYHGLALRRLGRRDEARGELELAVRFEPQLEPEVLLVRALDLFEVGEDEEALRLLRRILEIDPTGEAARRVRLILLEREARPMRRWYRLNALAGLEVDSNVNLDSGAADIPTSSEEEDIRGVWGAGLTLRPVRQRRYGLTLGYRFDQVLHRRLTEYDYISNLGYASATYRPTSRFALRLDGLAFNTRQNGSSYLTVASLQPNLLVQLGPRIGTTRLFADFEWRMYEETPSIPFFQRDAVAFGAGFEHYFDLWRDDAWGSVAGRFERSDTSAPTVGSFGGDYDRDQWEAQARLHVPLFWGVVGEGWMAFAYQSYRYDNYFGFMTDLVLERRSDTLLEGRLALTRAVSRFAKLELAWRATKRDSNIRPFDYRRHVIGLYLRVSSE